MSYGKHITDYLTYGHYLVEGHDSFGLYIDNKSSIEYPSNPEKLKETHYG
jgi:hypothetical protein